MATQNETPSIFEYVHPYCFELIDPPGTYYEDNRKKSDRIKRTLASKRMHFKAAATWIATAMRDPANFSYYPDGNVKFNDEFNPAIYDNGGTELVWLKSSLKPSVWIAEDLAYGGNELGHLRYLAQAMLNAMTELRDEGRREMTPAEIEQEFGLARGTVRQHIGRKEERLTELGAVRRPDQRTILVRRGYALKTWGAKS